MGAMKGGEIEEANARWTLYDDSSSMDRRLFFSSAKGTGDCKLGTGALAGWYNHRV